MFTNETITALLLSLGLGLLLGLQREWTRQPVAGIRTFPLFALAGALAALLAQSLEASVLATGLLGIIGLVIAGHVIEHRKEPDSDPGVTTEIALVLTFIVGAVIMMGHRVEGVVSAGVAVVLLHYKQRMHSWVERFGEGELRELTRLVLLGLVILPILPNRDMGYLDIFNPFEVWLLVVLIVGISLAAYLTSMFIGGRSGAVVSGVLGGLISSTATTVGMAKRSKDAPDTARICAVVAVVAGAIVFARVLVEVWVAGGEAGRAMLLPLGIMLGWSISMAGILAWTVPGGEKVSIEEEAPSEFKAAVVFALLYVGVLYLVAWTKQTLGQDALYGVAVVSGLTDMDAITLSTSKLVADGHLAASQGWRVILLGGLSNMVFKVGMVALLGSRRMLWPVLLAFAGIGLGAVIMWMTWPG